MKALEEKPRGSRLQLMNHRAVYSAFDLFPSSKGAATHIQHMTQTLFEHRKSGLLYCLGDEELPLYQKEGDFEIVRFQTKEQNFLKRSWAFGHRLMPILHDLKSHLEICHFRDPFSGMAMVSPASGKSRSVFEVNALPSVELPYRYQNLLPRTLDKLRGLEAHSLAEADKIVVPSKVISNYLVQKGVSLQKISWIPNGADVLSDRPKRPKSLGDRGRADASPTGGAIAGARGVMSRSGRLRR